MKYFCTKLLSTFGIPSLLRQLLVRHKRCVLTFHGILKERHRSIPATMKGGLSVSELDHIISWVTRHFKLLSPTQFLVTDLGGTLLTFDDGMANNYTNALPILERYSAPALWFVSTQHVRNPRNWLQYPRDKAFEFWANEKQIPEKWKQEIFDGLSEEQLINSARHPLITIGSHTVSHPLLTRCSNDQLERELLESRLYLEKLIDQPVELFAYPTSDYDKCVARAVRDAGYRAAFGLRFQNVGMPLYDIPRIDLYQANSDYLDMKLCGLPANQWLGKRLVRDSPNRKD